MFTATRVFVEIVCRFPTHMMILSEMSCRSPKSHSRGLDRASLSPLISENRQKAARWRRRAAGSRRGLLARLKSLGAVAAHRSRRCREIATRRAAQVPGTLAVSSLLAVVGEGAPLRRLRS